MGNLEKLPVLCSGTWNGNTSWDFFISQSLPDSTLCTAVCCVLTFKGQLVLIKNKRGWELPAGHIEERGEHTETIPEALKREAFEEGGAISKPAHIFGYKKLTSKEPVRKRGEEVAYYPFPYAYVVFAFVEADELVDNPLPLDVTERKTVTYREALQLLTDVSQYHCILEFLLIQKLISLTPS